MKTKINEARDFTPKERAKLERAAAIIERVMNSQEFADSVLNHKWLGVQGFADSEMTTFQVFDKLMRGSEALTPGDDCEMDIDITIYTSSWFKRGTVGYTYPSTVRTWINRRFFTWYSDEQVAANLVHEWCHKLGFDHDFYATKKRPFSVPYACGSIVEELAAKVQG